jgi:hypothetical protein
MKPSALPSRVKNSGEWAFFLSRKANKTDVLVITALLVLSTLTTLSVGDKAYDDAFITFRYARNLASGEGFVYNPGDSFLGTTTPLLTMALALSALTLPVTAIPEIGQWLCGLALFFCGLFVYLLGRDDGIPWAGFVGALLTLTHPLFLDVWGGEALLLLATVLAGFFFYFREREALCGVTLGLALLTRGEGVLPAIVLSSHFLIVNKRFPWRAALGWGAMVVPWVAFSIAYFGSPLPSTLQAKLAQMDSGYFAPFLTTSVRWLQAYAIPNPDLPLGSSYANAVVFMFAVFGGLYLMIHPRFRWWGIMVWLGSYGVAYSLLGVPFYHWYAAPLALGLAILAGLGAQLVLDSTKNYSRWLGRGIGVTSRALLVLTLALPVGRALMHLRDSYHRPISSVQRLYTNAGLWLHEHTPPTATVGYFEIGFVGYYSERPLVDPVGLINRGVSARVADGDFKWAYLHYRPDYLIINPVRWYDRIGNIRDETWFLDAYRQVATIEEPGYFDAPLTVYQKVNDAAIPPASD